MKPLLLIFALALILTTLEKTPNHGKTEPRNVQSFNENVFDIYNV